MRSVVLILAGAILLTTAACTNSSEQITKEALLRAHLTQMREALDKYYSDNGNYPYAIHDLVPGHLPTIPVDPFTGRNNTWVVVYEDIITHSGPPPKPGIYDIKSGAAGVTKDGLPINEL